MQKYIYILIFLISNFVFLYWCFSAYNGNKKSTLKLNLSKFQLISLLLFEIIIFISMYLNYSTGNIEETANSFAWNYIFIYLRGTIPLIALMNIYDSSYFNDPIILIFILCLISDYSILYLVSNLKNIKNGFQRYFKNILKIYFEKVNKL